MTTPIDDEIAMMERDAMSLSGEYQSSDLAFAVYCVAIQIAKFRRDLEPIFATVTATPMIINDSERRQ